MNHRNSAWCRLLLLVVSALILLPTDVCSAQPISISGGYITPGSETWGGYVIPNVDDKLSLASLLYNRTVAESLGVDIEGRKLIHDYLAKNSGSFKTKVVTYPRNDPKTREEIIAETEIHREASRVFLDKLISPRQWARLRQMAYQVEVGRLGLASALTQGRLGADSGIHGQQSDAIRRKAEEEEAKAKDEIVLILAKMQDEVFAELSSEQRNTAKLLLGDPIIFKEDLISSIHSGGGIVPGAEGEGGYVIPDVDNKLSLALLLNNHSIGQSLGLSDEGITLIHEYLVKNDRSFQRKAIAQSRDNRKSAEEMEEEIKAYRTQSAELLDELISPRQWARLRQLAYQVEVSRIGLADALTKGKLGADIGVEEQQTELIQGKSEEADARAKDDILRVLANMQDEVLAELTPGQRKEAKQLLGDPIVFQEELGSSLRIEIPGFGDSEVKRD